MLRHLAVIAIAATTIAAVAVPAVASDQIKEGAAAIAADVVYADDHCPGLKVDLPAASVLVFSVIRQDELKGSYAWRFNLQYNLRRVTAEDHGIATACQQIADLYGPGGEVDYGFLRVAASNPEPVPLLKDPLEIYQFDLSTFDDAQRQQLRLALHDTLRECPGLVEMPDVFAPVSATIHDVRAMPDMAIDYPGAREPWALRYELRFRVAGDPPRQYPHWHGHQFSLYINGDFTELTAQKRIGRELCGLEEASRGTNAVRRLK